MLNIGGHCQYKHCNTPPLAPLVRHGTFQPPAQCQDCALEVASQNWSFRNITPRSCEVCHSTDYTSVSTDCTGLSTDCQGYCQELPDKNVLPDVLVLPDVVKTVFLASWGEDIVGSEKTTGSLPLDAAVTRQEVVGLHACQLQPAHGAQTESHHTGPVTELVNL